MKKNQIRSQKGKEKGYFVDYQKIWLENGGELIKIDKHKYYKLHHSQKKPRRNPFTKTLHV